MMDRLQKHEVFLRLGSPGRQAGLDRLLRHSPSASFISSLWLEINDLSGCTLLVPDEQLFNFSVSHYADRAHGHR